MPSTAPRFVVIEGPLRRGAKILGVGFDVGSAWNDAAPQPATGQRRQTVALFSVGAPADDAPRWLTAPPGYRLRSDQPIACIYRYRREDGQWECEEEAGRSTGCGRTRREAHDALVEMHLMFSEGEGGELFRRDDSRGSPPVPSHSNVAPTRGTQTVWARVDEDGRLFVGDAWVEGDGWLSNLPPGQLFRLSFHRVEDAELRPLAMESTPRA